MRVVKAVLFSCIVLVGMFHFLASPLFGQNPQLRTRNGQRFPTVIFTHVYWPANPAYYSIAIDSTGTATYQSAPDSLESTGVPYTVEFHVSEKTRRATFNLAQNLSFFADEVAPSTGSPENSIVRTLAYHYTRLNNQITYSSSSDADVQELTSIFEEISETLEFGRRLAYSHQHDRNALAGEFKNMQNNGVRHHLRELEALAPVLSMIASDQTLDGRVREQAQALLQQARAQM